MPNTAPNTTAQVDPLLADLLAIQANKDTTQGRETPKADNKGLYPYVAEVENTLKFAESVGLKTADGKSPREALDEWMSKLTIQSKTLDRTISVKVAVKWWQLLNNSANFLLQEKVNGQANPAYDKVKGDDLKAKAHAISEELKVATEGKMNRSHDPAKKNGYFFWGTELKTMSDEQAEAALPVWMTR